MLTKNAARVFQVSAIFLLLALILASPALILSSLLPMVFTALYALLAWRRLRRIEPDIFATSLIASPNPALVNSDIRVKLVVALRRDLELPIEAQVETWELETSGKPGWRGVLRKGVEAVADFKVRSSEIGVRLLGPVFIALKDRLGVAVRELEVHPPLPILILSEALRLRAPAALQVSSRSPAPGLAENPFIGMPEEYRLSLPQTQEQPARLIDWRRTARSGGEELYVREYDRLRRGEVVFGVGGGLRVEVPGMGVAEQLALQPLLQIALAHLKAGSSPWLLAYAGRGEFTASPLLQSPEGVVLGQPQGMPPRGSLVVYVTRLIDPLEAEALSRLSKLTSLRLLLLDLGDGERLRRAAGRVEAWYSIVGVDELPQALWRALRVHGRIT